MARKKVVLIQCERCKREEFQQDTGDEKKEPDVYLKFFGQELKYFDCCERCKGAISSAIQGIKEWNRTINSILGPQVGPNEAPPASVAPDYSPPKPHSR